MESQKRKLIYVGEPPTVNTGFGTVSKGILPALAREFEITMLACGGYDRDCIPGLNDWGVTNVTVTQPDNAHSTHLLDGMIRQVQPAVIFSYYDVGSVHEFVDKTILSFYPHASYLVTEGAPIMEAWMRLYKDHFYAQGWHKNNYTIEQPIVASKFDADEAERATGRRPLIGYHGADHANFRVLHRDQRLGLRKQLESRIKDSLDDVTLLMYVARNADRKQWPRLFEAMAMFKTQHPEYKIKLLAHTKKFDMFKQGGWMLEKIMRDKGLEPSDVIFSEREDIGGAPFDSIVDSDPTMLKYYSMADIYVHPSGGEACGLPMLEAARCGLPVLATRYSGGWEYVEKFAAPLEVQTYVTDRTGLNWALVDKQQMVDQIYKLITNKNMYAQHRDLGLKHCNYRWAALGDICLAAANNAITKYKWNSNTELD